MVYHGHASLGNDSYLATGSYWSDVPLSATHDGTGETEGWPEESWHLRLSSSPGDSGKLHTNRRTLRAPAALATRGGVAAARHNHKVPRGRPFALSLLCGGTTARESVEGHVQPIPQGRPSRNQDLRRCRLLSASSAFVSLMQGGGGLAIPTRFTTHHTEIAGHWGKLTVWHFGPRMRTAKGRQATSPRLPMPVKGLSPDLTSILLRDWDGRNYGAGDLQPMSVGPAWEKP